MCGLKMHASPLSCTCGEGTEADARVAGHPPAHYPLLGERAERKVGQMHGRGCGQVEIVHCPVRPPSLLAHWHPTTSVSPQRGCWRWRETSPENLNRQL